MARTHVRCPSPSTSLSCGQIHSLPPPPLAPSSNAGPLRPVYPHRRAGPPLFSQRVCSVRYRVWRPLGELGTHVSTTRLAYNPRGRYQAISQTARWSLLTPDSGTHGDAPPPPSAATATCSACSGGGRPSLLSSNVPAMSFPWPARQRVYCVVLVCYVLVFT